MPDDFFKEKHGAAAMKHALLKRYLPVFVGKTGSTSGGIVYYIDAFAGPGEYDDGQSGSPLIALDLHYGLRSHRNLHGICIEKDARHFAELSDRLASTPGWVALHGTAEVCLPIALRRARTLPAFVFLDPFATKGLTFDTVVLTLKRIGKTEVLIRVHTSGVKRVAGMVASKKKTKAHREAVMAANDRFLGGDWWRTLPSLGSDQFVEDVLEGYVQRLSDAAGGYGYYFFPIEEAPGGAPKYWLVHMSRYPPALWEMAAQVSLTREDADPQTDFFREDGWVDEIRTNAISLLENEDSFVPSERAGQLYGTTLGHARELHVRKALRQMLEAGETSTVPKGRLARLRIHR